MKRQFHVIPPWGNSDTPSTDSVLLLEIPADEPFTFTITLVNSETVLVTIKAGSLSASSERWCTTYTFELTSDGSVTKSKYSGSTEVDRGDINDWQIWGYTRTKQVPYATDDFARAYQREYLPDVNTPALDPSDNDYYKRPMTTNALATGGQENLSIEVYDFDDDQLETLIENIKFDSAYTNPITVKSPSDPVTEIEGRQGYVTGYGSGWCRRLSNGEVDTRRWDGSHARVLGVSGVYTSL